MCTEDILGATDRLIGHREKPVEFAKIEFPSGEWGQGRGGGERWQHLVCIASELVNSHRARPAGSASRPRPSGCGGGLAQGCQMLEPVKSAL